MRILYVRRIKKEVVNLPNWNANNLKIYGEEKELRRFRLAAKGRPQVYAESRKEKDFKEPAVEDLCFNRIVPIPKALLKKSYGEGGGHDWEVKNWGVKWGASSPQLVQDEEFGYLDYSFDTPWEPPEA